MTDLIFILLGFATVVLMFVRHWLLLKRIRNIEDEIEVTKHKIYSLEQEHKMVIFPTYLKLNERVDYALGQIEGLCDKRTK